MNLTVILVIILDRPFRSELPHAADEEERDEHRGSDRRSPQPR